MTEKIHFLSIDEILERFPGSDGLGEFSGWTVYHSPEWLRLLSGYFGFLPRYAFMESDRDMAIMPLVISRRGRVSSPPASMYGHMLSSDEERYGYFSTAMVSALDEKYSKFNIRFIGDIGDGDSRFEANEVDARVPLLSDERSQWNALNGVARRGVRKAIKNGVVIKESKKQIKLWYPLIVKTRKRLNLPVTPYAWFEKVIDEEFSGLLMAYSGGEAIAGILYMKDEMNFHYAVPAMKSEAARVSAVDFLVWELMASAIREGKGWLCMGGSGVSNEGLRRFKAKWGVQERMVYQLSMPPGERNSRMPSVSVFRYMPAYVSGLMARVYLKYFW